MPRARLSASAPAWPAAGRKESSGAGPQRPNQIASTHLVAEHTYKPTKNAVIPRQCGPEAEVFVAGQRHARLRPQQRSIWPAADVDVGGWRVPNATTANGSATTGSWSSARARPAHAATRPALSAIPASRRCWGCDADGTCSTSSARSRPCDDHRAAFPRVRRPEALEIQIWHDDQGAHGQAGPIPSGNGADSRWVVQHARSLKIAEDARLWGPTDADLLMCTAGVPTNTAAVGGAGRRGEAAFFVVTASVTCWHINDSM